MLPNSATHKRIIHVAAGTSHSRTINTPSDPNIVPIVERMTRARLDKMPASQVAKWRNESIKAIQDLSPRKSERDGVITQFFERRHTHEAPSPLKAKEGVEGEEGNDSSDDDGQLNTGKRPAHSRVVDSSDEEGAHADSPCNKKPKS